MDLTGDACSSSDDSVPASRRATRRRTRLLERRRATKRDNDAVGAIVQASRLNHRQAAVETYRRQQLARQLQQDDCPAEDRCWASFLDCTPDEVEPALAPPPTGPASSSSTSSAPGSTTSCSSSKPSPKGGTDFASNARAGFAQTPARTRPTRGSTRNTTAANKAAVDSLLGRQAKKGG